MIDATPSSDGLAGSLSGTVVRNVSGKLFHTTQWDHDYELTGRRVAMIGTGSTASQVIPAIAPQVDHLTVFERSARDVRGSADDRR